MKDNYCHIISIIDKSGSMGILQDEVIKSFNNFLKEQKEVEGEATISMIQFNHVHDYIFSFKNINDIDGLCHRTYSPHGMTALYDAIGYALNTEGKKLAEMKEEDRPSKVVVIIQTDGYENASTDFTRSKIKEMIEEQKSKYSWEFVFMGADIDATAVSQGIGIDASNAIKYVNTDAGTNVVFASISANLAFNSSILLMYSSLLIFPFLKYSI